MENKEQQLDTCSQLLKTSEEYGLTTEVVIDALSAMKANPKLEISEALQYGFDEWVK